MCKETDFTKCGACPYIGHSCCNRIEKCFDTKEPQIEIRILCQDEATEPDTWGRMV